MYVKRKQIFEGGGLMIFCRRGVAPSLFPTTDIQDIDHKFKFCLNLHLFVVFLPVCTSDVWYSTLNLYTEQCQCYTVLLSFIRLLFPVALSMLMTQAFLSGSIKCIYS